ncbi:MAG: MOSC domain-containing protein [Rhizobiales bacterium]|nr:MOSC domain-containing protein [Hyphomicrobiales bacterium]
MTQITLNSINRFPIKGFTVDQLQKTSLTIGKTILGDRKYSFQDGEIDFDEYDPQHFRKTKFIVLVNRQKVASLNTSFDAAGDYLTIKKDNKILIEGDLTSSSDRREIEFFINDYFEGDLKSDTKILFAQDESGYSFSDVKPKCISILNLASLRQFEQDTGLTIDPIRFRCNLHIDGLPAFEELNLIDQNLKIGDVQLNIFKKIVRCPAVDVNPTTAMRDTDLNKLLKQHYNHMFMGVYAMVKQKGEIKVGDNIMR